MFELKLYQIKIYQCDLSQFVISTKFMQIKTHEIKLSYTSYGLVKLMHDKNKWYYQDAKSK